MRLKETIVSYSGRLAPDRGQSFGALRELQAELGSARGAEKIPEELLGAVVLLEELVGCVIADLTRSVPWDDDDELKNTRRRALALIKDTIGRFESENGLELFLSLGAAHRRYDRIVDEINTKDRNSLIKMQGTKDGQR